MSDSIASLDEDYVRLGRAAALVAQERQQFDADEVMDLFKRALFAGQFDPPPFEFGERRNQSCNWLQMEIEAPRCTLPPSQATMSVRPKQLYSVNRGTVASVLLTTSALPGGRANWEPLFDIGVPDYSAEDGFSALASMPFRDFPERGRQELEAIIAPKAKLARWFEERGLPAPKLLIATVQEEPEPDASEGTGSISSESAAADMRPAGRPVKAAWPRIVELVRQLTSEHPEWQKKRLAFEAWSRAREEFDKSEVPSVATIQRSMVEILAGA